MSYSKDEVLSIIKEFQQNSSQADAQELAQQIGQALGQSKTQDAISSDVSTRTVRDTDVGMDEVLRSNAAFDQALITLNKKGQADAYGAVIIGNFLENQRQQTAQFEQRMRESNELFSERRDRSKNLLSIDTKTLDLQDSATPAK